MGDGQPKVVSGKLTARPRPVALVVSRFNELVTSRLLGGALDALKRHGFEPDQCTVVWVPGAYELPLMAKKVAQSGAFGGIVALGAVIRGGTPHFEYVAAECTKGIAQVMLETGLPIGFGVLTTDTLEQALERAGSKSGNKGAEAALSVIELLDALDQVDRLKAATAG